MAATQMHVPKSKIYTAVRAHIGRSWPNSRRTEYELHEAPIQAHVPEFTVCRVDPLTSDDEWIYISIGAWEIHSQADEHMEFMILSPRKDPGHVELLAMVAAFHADRDYGVHLGKLIRIGRPWMRGSSCDHLLVSLPYPIGHEFEWCRVDDAAVRFLWLLPITSTEAEFMRKHGQEALEARLDEAAANYLDPRRASVA